MRTGISVRNDPRWAGSRRANFALVVLDSEIEAGAALAIATQMGPFTAKSQVLLFLSCFPTLRTRNAFPSCNALFQEPRLHIASSHDIKWTNAPSEEIALPGSSRSRAQRKHSFLSQLPNLLKQQTCFARPAASLHTLRCRGSRIWQSCSIGILGKLGGFQE